MLRIPRDVVGERKADDEGRERPDDRQLERGEEDVAVDVEFADDVVPQVAVVVERPRVGDVGEPDDRPEARRDDEAERDEEEQDVPRDRREYQPAWVPRPARTGAGSAAPVLTFGRFPPQLPPERLTFSIAEAATMLGISKSTAYECAHRGELPVLTFGRFQPTTP